MRERAARHEQITDTPWQPRGGHPCCYIRRRPTGRLRCQVDHAGRCGAFIRKATNERQAQTSSHRKNTIGRNETHMHREVTIGTQVTGQMRLSGSMSAHASEASHFSSPVPEADPRRGMTNDLRGLALEQPQSSSPPFASHERSPRKIERACSFSRPVTMSECP